MLSAGIKWVSGYPDNPKQDLPYISGLMILNDFETGLPYSVMDCTWITGYRTGGATALAARYLARPESKTAGIVACGLQGRTNLEALAALFPLERVYAYDILPENQDRFIKKMSDKLGIEIIGVDSPKEAVVKSDLVVTSGPILKNPHPTIEKDWLQPGSFASAVDFDSYWYPEAQTQIDKFITDDITQMDYYRSTGYFQERSMAMNLGLAIDEMAVGPEVYRRAVKLGIGTWLEL